MTEKMKPYLIVQEGGRKELGRQLIRALVEFRINVARALAERIAREALLRLVDDIKYVVPPGSTGD
jgi:hypothetical protein